MEKSEKIEGLEDQKGSTMLHKAYHNGRNVFFQRLYTMNYRKVVSDEVYPKAIGTNF